MNIVSELRKARQLLEYEALENNTSKDSSVLRIINGVIEHIESSGVASTDEPVTLTEVDEVPPGPPRICRKCGTAFSASIRGIVIRRVLLNTSKSWTKTGRAGSDSMVRRTTPTPATASRCMALTNSMIECIL